MLKTSRSPGDVRSSTKEGIIVANHQQKRRSDGEGAEHAQQMIKRLRKQLALLTDDVTLDGDDDALTRKVTAIKREMKSWEDRIKDAKPTERRPAADLAQTIEQLAQEFQEFGLQLGGADVPAIQRIMGTLVGRLEADLETKTVEIDLALPSWMAGVLEGSGRVGLEALSAYKPLIEAHPEDSLILARFRCDAERVPRRTCFRCHRLSRAA